MTGTIKIQCGCGRNLKIKETALGRAVNCPACGEPLNVIRATDDHFEEAVLSVLNESSVHTSSNDSRNRSWLKTATGWLNSAKQPVAQIAEFPTPADEPPEYQSPKRHDIARPPVPRAKSFTILGCLTSIIVTAIAIPLVAFALMLGLLITGAVFGSGRSNNSQLTVSNSYRDSTPSTVSVGSSGAAYVPPQSTPSSQQVSEYRKESAKAEQPPAKDDKSLWRKASEAMHPGKEYVKGYTRKDGTVVEGYWRKK